MSLARIAKWMSSEKGKSLTFTLATTAVVGTAGTQLSIHTFFLDKYKEFLQLYSTSIPVPVEKNVEERFSKTLDLLKVSEDERKYLKTFSILGFDVYHIGSLLSKYGGYVGIPINFSYTSKDKIDKKDIIVGGETVNWSKEEANQLLDSLVLSEKAQFYGLAREVKALQSIKFYLDIAIAPVIISLAYALGVNFNQKMGDIRGPRGVRVIMYSLIALFSGGLYALLKDLSQIEFEKSVDKQLCELDPIFVEGGEEFYSQILKRNKALAALLGDQGKKVYSAKGNDVFILRQKHMPFTDRHLLFAEKLKELQGSQTQ